MNGQEDVPLGQRAIKLACAHRMIRCPESTWDHAFFHSQALSNQEECPSKKRVAIPRQR